MADELDNAQDLIETSLATALSMINTKPEADYTGYCLNCGEATKAGQRFCDVTCRNDWQHRKDRC